MALSNRDRIGRAFEQLALGLGPFVNARMSGAVPDGTDWVAVIEARDQAKNGGNKRFSISDPSFLLKVVTEDWRVFKDHLSRVEQSFASELRDVRNRWAHNDAFSGDDTYRALDTMERLLTAVGAPDQADEVRQLRLDHQKAAFESDTKKRIRQQESVVTVTGTGLAPWREVIQPHHDVATGNFSASEFAADLHMVAHGEGAAEYVDPVEFFRRTYLTAGLSELLNRTVARMGGDDNASPIINLQTNFGGGKTHSMLGLWHLLSGVPVRVVSAGGPGLGGRPGVAPQGSSGGSRGDTYVSGVGESKAGWDRGRHDLG